jgi:hypothetical protein
MEDKIEAEEMFIEIMTHILTIEEVLMGKYDISEKAMKECINKNREYIREQLK